MLALQANVISTTVNLTVNSARLAVSDLEKLIEKTLKTEVYTARKSTGIFNASDQSTNLGSIGEFNESLLGSLDFKSYFYELKRWNPPRKEGSQWSQPGRAGCDYLYIQV